MDDFRVGSVPSSDAYGHRQPSGSIARRRERRHDGEGAEPQDEAADTFELAEDGDAILETAAEQIEDYYLPSDPNADAE
jgi:hypothetical protein